MYTIDDKRAEALQAVMAKFVQQRVRPVECSATDAWVVLAEMAHSSPDSRIGQYYWYSGELEQYRFMTAFDVWKQAANGY